MNEVLSWELLGTIESWLSQISVAAGYRTDLGAAVTREPASTSAKAPRIVIVATDMPIAKSTSQGRQGSEEIIIEAEIPASRVDAMQLAHAALADILDALPLKQVGRGLPDQTAGVEITGRRILPRADGADFVIAQVTARAALIERPTARS